MARAQLRRRTGIPSGLEIGLTFQSWQDGSVCAGPLEVVACQLGQPLELVTEAAAEVEPYWHADGTPRWSVHLLAIALGQRQSRRDRRRQLERNRAAARGRAAAARNRAAG